MAKKKKGFSKVVKKSRAKEGDMFFTDDGGLSGIGVVRTDERCTHCSKPIVFELDFNQNGNFVVICPQCGHQHCRVIEDGKVTKDRWDSRYEQVEIPKDSTWRSPLGGATASAAYAHIRSKWLAG